MNNNSNLCLISDEDLCFTGNISCPENTHCVHIHPADTVQCVCNPEFAGNSCQCEEFELNYTKFFDLYIKTKCLLIDRK